MTFKVGDVVRLKSGGYPMTVMCLRSAQMSDCVWHDETGTPHGYAYPNDILLPETPTEQVANQIPVESILGESWRGKRGLT